MKTELKIKICSNLKEIIKQYCKYNDITMSEFISITISNELNIPLTNKNNVDDKTFAKHQLEYINLQIKDLEAKKREYEGKI